MSRLLALVDSYKNRVVDMAMRHPWQPHGYRDARGLTCSGPGQSPVWLERDIALIVLSTLVAAALVVVQRPAEASNRERPRCHGRLATIVGNAEDNRLTGTSGRDVIWGGAGRDRIVGGAGNDVICGGPQGDDLHGGPGNDRLYGGSQHDVDPDLPGDVLSGGLGDDLLAPQHSGRTDYIDYRSSRRAVHVKRDIVLGEGVDRLVMEVPATIFLSKHDDSYIGTAAKDLVWSEGGDDTVRTGAGDDWVLFKDGRAGDGLDRAWLGAGNDSVWGWDDRLSAVAGRGDDSITGGPLGGPRVEGGPGADFVSIDVPPVGDNGAEGGPGVDTLSIFLSQLSSWNMATGEAHVGPAAGDVVLFTGFENGGLASHARSLTVTGTAGPNSLATFNVRTTFVGMAGNDRFTGTEHVDTFDGGPGEDQYIDDGSPDPGEQVRLGRGRSGGCLLALTGTSDCPRQQSGNTQRCCGRPNPPSSPPGPGTQIPESRTRTVTSGRV
jgi:hypothetical protein